MNIFEYFSRSRKNYPQNTALVVDGTSFTYEELGRLVDKITASIQESPGESTFIGLLAHRSLTAYAGILGILQAGRAYVPLNPKFPPNRNQDILVQAGMSELIVGPEGVEHLRELRSIMSGASQVHGPMVPDTELRTHEEDWVAGQTYFENQAKTSLTPKETQDYAYMLFTSGSTGKPKGVPIGHDNVSSYVDYLRKRYQFSPQDRFTQAFDLTFDLSVHDMFMCWQAGACLYCIPEQSVMGPAKFIRDNQLTVWFSVQQLPCL